MKQILLTLALIATTAFSVSSLRAQDTNLVATNATAAATNATTAATNGPPAAWTTNAPTVEQRLESIEAYFQNGDPTATYKDTNGNWTVNFGLAPNIIIGRLSTRHKTVRRGPQRRAGAIEF
jgi:hypothetical protein